MNAVVPDCELQAALPEYDGWCSTYVYPGFIGYVHPDSDVMVCASSDFNDDDDAHLDIQIQVSNGLIMNDGENAPWPHEGRSAEKMFARIRPYLDKYHPSTAPVASTTKES